ncbi:MULTISPECIES: polymorphic toxin type 44 domain-containing protein [Pseudomonas]|uniref:polymorphic toxin type 44 domain-containing protein n=1 Tax=Pseudomonas TaxID=286 RepID=UPI0009315D60|nr:MULTISPECIES: polymorphic toxin type 44 domain-containing protein [Pseudomonas]MDT8906158.1 polymorphic toxin type 44 domain-containing protein [Pseudomonas prosekii]NHN67517.1 hypothetical protein [Pseudomonas fluorescens]
MDQPIHQERNAIINRYQLDKASLEKRVQAEQRGREYEEFGNFNYGATGTVAGISEQILLRAAGAAQSIAGTSEEEFGKWWAESPYGDDELDQIWIKAGIRYAQSKDI